MEDSMDPLALNLIMIAGLFLLGAAGEMIFARTQVPDVVWLILAGVILNATPDSSTPAALDDVLPLFAALTLIIMLVRRRLQAGASRIWFKLGSARERSSRYLSFITQRPWRGHGDGPSAASAIGMLPESWGLMHGIMIGAMLGGSSSLIVMPSMELAKVEEKVANLVGLESALTDALCVVVTVAMIGILVTRRKRRCLGRRHCGSCWARASASPCSSASWSPAGCGCPVMARMLQGSPHAYPVTLAALIMLYVVVDRAGGSAAMAILAFAVLVGNADALMKRVGFQMGVKPLALDETVVTTHTQVSFIIKTFFFTFIGLMLGEPISLLLFGVVIGIFLLIARVPAVRLAIRGAGFSPADTKMITVSLPRGMAAGVLATMPAQAGVAGTKNLPSLVFAAVVTSILVFAAGFKQARAAAQAEGPKPDAQPQPEPQAGQTMPGASQPALPEGPGPGPATGVPPTQPLPAQSMAPQPMPSQPGMQPPAPQAPMQPAPMPQQAPVQPAPMPPPGQTMPAQAPVAPQQPMPSQVPVAPQPPMPQQAPVAPHPPMPQQAPFPQQPLPPQAPAPGAMPPDPVQPQAHPVTQPSPIPGGPHDPGENR